MNWGRPARIMFEEKARDRGVVFKISCSPNMPMTILGDEQRITQILLNLAENAIKFTKEGYVHILIEPADYDARWRLVGEDTGRGIQEENLDRIKPGLREYSSVQKLPSQTPPV